jgi:hypothetical protein
MLISNLFLGIILLNTQNNHLMKILNHLCAQILMNMRTWSTKKSETHTTEQAMFSSWGFLQGFADEGETFFE